MPTNGRLTEAERMRIWPIITYKLGITPVSPEMDHMEDVLIEAYKMFQECGLLGKMQEIIYGIDAEMVDLECCPDLGEAGSDGISDNVKSINNLVAKAKKLIENNII